MNSRKWITGIAVLAIGTTLAIAAPQGGQGWGGHRGGKLAQRLNLTDPQRQELRDLNKQFRRDNQPFFQSVRQTRQEVRAAKEANDTARLDALKPAIEAQKAQIHQLRGAQEAKMLTILTPDQQAQFQALKAERAAKRAHRCLAPGTRH